MTQTIDILDGGYRSLPLVPQFAAGVAALPGYALHRVRFETPVPVAEGFDIIAAHLERLGRPPTAFTACELRSPEPFTEQSFAAFNAVYLRTLEAWGILRDGINPIARTNVCPSVAPPPTPSFHAFSYTVEARQAAPSFVIAGSCEVPENQPGPYVSHIVRHGETSPDALRDKAHFVLAELERRLAALDASWGGVTATQAYTVHDLGFLMPETAERGAMPHGLTWHRHHPPVIGLSYEMDCRRVLSETVLPASLSNTVS